MKYRTQPQLQVSSAVIGAAAVTLLGFIVYGQVDWVTVGAVAVGVAIGMGFAPQDEPVDLSEKSNSLDDQ